MPSSTGKQDYSDYLAEIENMVTILAFVNQMNKGELF